MRKHLRGDADARVPHAQHDRLGRGFDRQPDPATGVRVLGRIFKQVCQHLCQPGRVGLQGHWREGDFQDVAAFVDAGLNRLDRQVHYLGKVHQPFL